jgi:hypothetical protein
VAAADLDDARWRPAAHHSIGYRRIEPGEPILLETRCRWFTAEAGEVDFVARELSQLRGEGRFARRQKAFETLAILWRHGAH